jgi:hypothetical protein
MTSSYYLWKWADNDLPGQPNEVFSELLHGRLHPALQTFDARPVLADLRTMAATHGAFAEEWDLQMQPAECPERTHFVFLRCPEIPRYGARCDQFIDLVTPHQLSGYDEEQGNIIECLLPKLNMLALGESRVRYDISVKDLTVLLGRLHHKQSEPHAKLTNHLCNYVQCYLYRDGFEVEWRKKSNPNIPKSYDQWRAGDLKRMRTNRRPQIVTECRVFNSELHEVRMRQFPGERLCFGDALRIFQAFLRGDPRPIKYHWRSIRQELERAKQKLQKAKPHE